MDFNVPANHRVKLKGEKSVKYVKLARELKKKTMKDESDGGINFISALRKITKELLRRMGDLKISRQVDTMKSVLKT